MFPEMPFIAPCLPRFRKEPPAGPAWTHEIKFHGIRVQIHRNGQYVSIYGRGGEDVTRHCPTLLRTLLKVGTQNFIIEGALCACEGPGNPDFGAGLMGLAGEHCIWVFDILAERGKDCRALPYGTRRYKRDGFMARIGSPILRNSPTFSHPHALLAACARRNIEGIVSKRTDRPYRSGRSVDWIKVTSAGWAGKCPWPYDLDRRI
jgi:bifunctional non-homologous end joining protein LigD